MASWPKRNRNLTLLARACFHVPGHKRKKTAGHDDWRPGDLALLPQEWFALLALLWNAILKNGAAVPEIWKHVRVKLIPKNDGTANMRPLGIASIAWRLRVMELMLSLKPWVLSWLSPDVASGPERSADDLIERMAEAIARQEPLLGAKIDLSKCFDRISHIRALRLLQKFGLPDEVARIVMDFHDGVTMQLECDGAHSNEPLRVRNGVIQGCSFSVLAMLAEASNYCRWIRAQAQVEVGAYYDDRTIWATGPSKEREMRKALLATQRYDMDAGWLWNDGKGQNFQIGSDSIANDGILAQVGKQKDMLTLIGVDLPTCAYTYTDKVRDVAFGKAKRELRRICIGVPGKSGRDRYRRRNIVNALVLPKLVWGAHWFRPCFLTLRRWDSMIERCVNG